MFKSAIGILSALVLISMTLGAANAQNPVVDALKGCSKEIETYCSSVTPGGGRLVSCARAHEDKLSSECVYSLNVLAIGWKPWRAPYPMLFLSVRRTR